jgi:hypothetical protein
MTQAYVAHVLSTRCSRRRRLILLRNFAVLLLRCAAPGFSVVLGVLSDFDSHSYARGWPSRFEGEYSDKDSLLFERSLAEAHPQRRTLA